MVVEKKDKPAKRKGKSLLKLLKRLFVILVCFVLAVNVGWRIFFAVYYPENFTFSGDRSVMDEPIIKTTGVTKIADSYLTKRQGIYTMSLKGDPFEIGYCNARLTEDILFQQEQSLFSTIKQFVPSKAAVWLLHKYISIRNRDLPQYIKGEYQIEIQGIASGYPDFFPQFGSLYYRMLNYHAAHDISHAVMDNPLVGCTSFAAWSGATANGNLILGRNFDFNAGECFDKNKIVMHVQPTKGLRFISVAWPGMIGVVSGMNEAKIAVTINAGQSESTGTIGTPVSLVIRDVLQHCTTIDQAVDVIRKSQVFVADSYLVADGKSGQAVLVEKTPAKTAVVKPAKDYIVSSNHFMSSELKDDPSNLEYMVQGTTVQRYDRMEKLLGSHYGKVDIETTAAILRDRTVETMPNSMGNAIAINPLIATHSVIIDATQGVIWVSDYPHQLGHYVPFSIVDFDEQSKYKTIAPDPLLDSEEYINYQRAMQMLQKAKKIQDDKKVIGFLNKADNLNPSDYMASMTLGELYYKSGEYAQAKQYLLKAKKLFPAYETERQTIENLIKKIDEQVLKVQ